MRRSDPPQVFKTAACCCKDCSSKWISWCRGCNLVFCRDHADMKTHACKRRDLERGLPGAAALSPKRKKKRTTVPAKIQSPETDLPFEGPNGDPTNG